MKKVLIVLIILLSSCEYYVRELVIDGVPERGLLVVHAYLTNHDSLFKVFVDRAIPSIPQADTGQNDFNIENTLVQLKHNGTIHTLLFGEEEYNLYFYIHNDSFGLNPGAQYELLITTSFKDSVYSSLIYPESGIDKESFVLTEYEDDRGNESYKMSWTDFSSDLNYYVVYGTTYHGRCFGRCQDSIIYVISNDLVADLISDQYQGETIHTTDEFQHRFDGRYYFIGTTTETVYLHKGTIDAQHDLSEFPFAEPVNLHTNIEGGLGIFGAFNFDFVVQGPISY
jgi:hypothetical protein